MKKINVLQLVTGLAMGGAEKVVFDLAKYTNRNAFNTFVLALSKNDERLEEFKNNNINTTILRKSKGLKDFIQIIKAVNSFIKKNKIDIIHAHMTHSVIIASFIKIINPSIKIVYTSHNLNIGSRLRELIVWSLKSFRDIDIIFSKDILKYFYKKNYQIIPNGIKVEDYDLDLIKYKKFTFIAVGRIEDVKNHKFLIEIAKILKNKFDFEIQIVGEGSSKDELKRLIEQYELNDTVKLLGLRNDIPQLLNKSHCLLMPSLWEGLPIVILEAGASRLPVISTPVGSITSLLNDNNAYVTGLDKFQENMINVMTNYEEAEKKGLNLFKNVNEYYSIEAVVQAHEIIYKGLVK